MEPDQLALDNKASILCERDHFNTRNIFSGMASIVGSKQDPISDLSNSASETQTV